MIHTRIKLYQIYIIENKIFYSNTIFSQLTNKPIIKIGENV